MRRQRSQSARASGVGLSLLLVLLIRVGILAFEVNQFPYSAVLTAADIEDAITMAQRGDLAPYLIRQPIGGGPDPKAAVYTPFVRVGLATQAGVEISDDRLQARGADWLMSREILVVISSPCQHEPQCIVLGHMFDPRVVPPSRVFISQQRLSPSRAAPVIAATRILDDQSLTWLGPIPLAQPLVAATFAPEAFVPGAYVVAEWQVTKDISAYAGGRLRQTEMTGWR